MTANGNIVEFPGYYYPGNIPEDPDTMEAVQDRIDIIKDVFIESATEAVVTNVLHSIGAAGFEQDESEESIKDAALLQASIKSLMMRTRGMSHPLQTVADEMFQVVEDKDGYVYVEAKR